MKKLWKRIKQGWQRYLERLGKINEELYGKGPLDCCDLNKDDRPKGHQAHQS